MATGFFCRNAQYLLHLSEFLNQTASGKSCLRYFVTRFLQLVKRIKCAKMFNHGKGSLDEKFQFIYSISATTR